MEPFRPFLSPCHQFTWNPELDAAFQTSKAAIVDAIKEGLEIFDLHRPTCLRPDYSNRRIGYFLLQKHCQCESDVPDCCPGGWRISLAGSRFSRTTLCTHRRRGFGCRLGPRAFKILHTWMWSSHRRNWSQAARQNIWWQDTRWDNKHSSLPSKATNTTMVFWYRSPPRKNQPCCWCRITPSISRRRACWIYKGRHGWTNNRCCHSTRCWVLNVDHVGAPIRRDEERSWHVDTFRDNSSRISRWFSSAPTHCCIALAIPPWSLWIWRCNCIRW